MTSTHLLDQSNPPLSPRLTLPTMYDLPSEAIGESGLPDEFHRLQAELLRITFKPSNWSPEEVFCATESILRRETSSMV